MRHRRWFLLLLCALLLFSALACGISGQIVITVVPPDRVPPHPPPLPKAPPPGAPPPQAPPSP
jgi:hypothetical protein